MRSANRLAPGEPLVPFSAVMPAPFGPIGIATRSEYIHEIVFLPASHPLQAAGNVLAEKAVAQIDLYLKDPEAQFNLPLSARGTPYRHRVWAAISAIPRGQTRTYGALAHDMHSIARAVGQACGDNPFPLIIPCHRVVAAGGIGGFAHDRDGFRIETKCWLLAHEGASATVEDIQFRLFETPPDSFGQPST